MTIDELWNNIKPMLEKIPKMEEQLKELPAMKEQLQELTQERIPKMEKQLKELPTMRRDIQDIKNVNFSAIIKYQIQLSQEIKDVETRLTKKIDDYMGEINVKHKEFDYRISNLEWKTKVAN